MAEARIIRPQQGYQEKVLSSNADIVIGGGAAGLGKTYSLLLEFTRHVDNPKWGGVIFRRTSPQIRNEGGLWDTSRDIFSGLNASPKESVLEWHFKSGSKLKFSHLEHQKNIYDWQGAQIPFIGFDELTHFSETMFFYLLSRNRSTCGVNPYVRATTNPDPESWVAKLIEWWIDPITGYPIPDRDGVVRYFIKNGGDYIWGNSRSEVIEKSSFFLDEVIGESGISANDFVKSITFISGSIYENKALLNTNPEYLANLLSQDEQTQLQLLKGNWKVVITPEDVYNYPAFIGMFENIAYKKADGRYITADIALEGSDKLVIGVWYGYELVDIEVLSKSDGKVVYEKIEGLAKKHNVQNRHIAYDNDGVGGYLGGFIKTSIPFVNNSSALPDPNQRSGKAENYQNLKAQCYYNSGKGVSGGKYRISEEVANRMYDDKMTIRQRFIHERKAIKKAKKTDDGKLGLIKKDEMKSKLNGESPDLMDMFMMREIFDLTPSRTWIAV